ncbi:MAG: LruC domain-containing protein [Balneolales bacterium]|nr:LruC domain-containing protein [Balneolales bacterium]
MIKPLHTTIVKAAAVFALNSGRYCQRQTAINSRQLLFFGLISLFALFNKPAVHAQIAISSVDAVYDSVTDNSKNYTLDGLNYRFNSGNENNLLVLSVDAGGRTYVPAIFADRIEMQRVSIPGIPDEREIFFMEGNVSGSNVNLKPSFVNNMKEVLLNPVLNRGVDNIFQQTGDGNGNQNNVMRLDFIFNDGILAPASVSQEGFIIKERGGNDSFRIAVITSLDANGNPATFGPAVTAQASNWGPSGFSLRTQVLRKPNPDAQVAMSANLDPQPLSGILFTFAQLGVSAGDRIYGYSLTAGDSPTNTANWLDVSTFPTDTNAAFGGLDLVAGGAFFSSNPVIVAENDFFTMPVQSVLQNTVAGNDTFQNGSQFTLDNQPSNGTIVFNADGSFSYTPFTGFEGTDTFTYTLCLPEPIDYICDTAVATINVESSFSEIINYFPAAGPGTLAFEDLWPSLGDFDFNDMVVDYRFKITSNAVNVVEKIEATFVLRAFGAGFRNGFGFQLSNAIQSNHIAVSGYSITENFITLNSNGTEAGQSKPTIIVFDNTYNEMQHPGTGIGVNTDPDAPFVTPAVFNITIDFVGGSYTYGDLNISEFNPFIIVNRDRGREVHLPNYPPTDLANMDFFGTRDDRSRPNQNRWYMSENNLPWAINLIHSFEYPIERVDIIDAYPRFIDWAQSGGTDFPDWFSNTASHYRNPANIYNKN